MAKTGSSPLSRGIRSPGFRVPAPVRIIPALAGNTSRTNRGSVLRTDHPRSRGEYAMCFLMAAAGFGSSPLSRGIRPPVRSGEPFSGIIPALAGNTTTATIPTGASTDHPRSRGEYADKIAPSVKKQGSSPLSRGIPIRWGRSCRGRRIIPALAGNTTPAAARPRMRPDHPRSRGEYSLFREHYANGGGSSPLSRGIPTIPEPHPPRRRIIPALAGNT